MGKILNNFFINKCFCSSYHLLESICCQNGSITLQQPPMPPPILKGLLEGTDERHHTSKKYIICLNSALALASIKIRYKDSNTGIYKPQIVITEKCKPKDAPPRTYNVHNLQELSIMMPDEVGSRDIIKRNVEGAYKR